MSCRLLHRTRDALSFRFLGIPFADPFERFTYSKPFSASATISALSYGSPCTQSTYGSDDCLFLNIYTPFLPANENANGAKAAGLKPVLFWIYGGGFTGGESNDGIFDGGNLVSRGDVVVVSANYRLGTQGFLALNDGVTNGNFGIADQVNYLILPVSSSSSISFSFHADTPRPPSPPRSPPSNGSARTSRPSAGTPPASPSSGNPPAQAPCAPSSAPRPPLGSSTAPSRRATSAGSGTPRRTRST